MRNAFLLLLVIFTFSHTEGQNKSYNKHSIWNIRKIYIGEKFVKRGYDYNTIWECSDVEYDKKDQIYIVYLTNGTETISTYGLPTFESFYPKYPSSPVPDIISLVADKKLKETYSKYYVDIMLGELKAGMNQNIVRLILGQPSHQTDYSNGESIWNYYSKTLLFENYKLKSWSDYH